MSARAELLDDRGAEASSEDFFRSPPFLRAEGVTHTLRVDAPDLTVSLPVIVRDVAGSRLADAISPYGYPGATLRGAGAPPEPRDVDWAETGLISVFVREPVAGRASLAGARERSTVLLHDPSHAREIRPRLAEQIRANARRGWDVEAVPGPGATDADLDAFAALYGQTMHRARAASRYFFEPGYFRSVLGFQGSWLLLARNAGVRAGAGAIAAASDGVLHYYLGGTADEALGESPFKNVVAAMLDLADELAVPLNLGGGVSPGDGLESFKRGFANAEAPFRTSEVICDRPEYERLAAEHPDAGAFFPAYRAP